MRKDENTGALAQESELAPAGQTCSVGTGRFSGVRLELGQISLSHVN